MIQMQTNLVVADNTGAKEVMMVRRLGQKKRIASVGDVIVVAGESAVNFLIIGLQILPEGVEHPFLLSGIVTAVVPFALLSDQLKCLGRLAQRLLPTGNQGIPQRLAILGVAAKRFFEGVQAVFRHVESIIP